MVAVPAAVTGKLRTLAKAAAASRCPFKQRKVAAFVTFVVLLYKRIPYALPPGYLTAVVRYRGFWRDVRDAGLQHFPELAWIRFCGFGPSAVNQAVRALSLDPELASLVPGSRYWRRLDPRARPTCDVLDVVVLVFRELATIGYQHQLEIDMGIIRSLLGKYLRRGKAALLRWLKDLPAARVGLFKGPLMGKVAHESLEAQHGVCPRRFGSAKQPLYVGYALDGTVTPILIPSDPHLAIKFWSLSKRHHGFSCIFLVSPFGTVHAARLGLPGYQNDSRGAELIFAQIFNPVINPSRDGVLVDFGLADYCNVGPDVPPVLRPFQPAKDRMIVDRAQAGEAAELSRWVTTCRQYNEWVNGTLKRGFPRWLVRRDIKFMDKLLEDLELYILLHNFRVRTCEWSQTRTVYLRHAEELFAQQGLVFVEATGTYDFVVGAERADP